MSSEKNSLTREAVDRLTEEMDAFLQDQVADRRDRIGTVLALENMILNVYETMGDKVSYTFCTGKIFRRPYIRFSYTGEAFDPRTVSSDPSEEWSRRILSDLGLYPSWSYKKGVNTIELRLKKKSMGSVASIVLSIVFAAVLGFGGKFLLPAAAVNYLRELLINPLQKMFLALLSTFAGIMIFFSVVCGIINMGDISSFSKIGKKMLARQIGYTFVIAAAAAFICSFVFSVGWAGRDGTALSVRGISDVLSLIYDIVPKDPVSPFLNGNAMQIVFLSFIFGTAILILGDKVENVRNVAQEMNTIIMGILDWICKLLPFYILCLLLNMIWADMFHQIVQVWKPFLVSAVIVVCAFTLVVLYVSMKYKMSVILLVKKLMPPFIVCLTTASSTAGFSKTLDISEKRLGIDKVFAEMSLPIRNVLYMPGFVIENVVIICSMAQLYEIKTGIAWMIMGILVCSILTIAMPPIPGSGAIIFGIMFAQMGIPAEAMVFAMTCDTFFDFLDTAVINSMGIMESILEADKFHLLDRDMLRKPL